MPRKNESDKRKENENIVNNKKEDEKTTNKKENIKEEIANKNNNAKEEIANKNNNEKEEIVNKNNNANEEITNKSNKIKEKVADEKDSEEEKIAKKDQYDIEKLKSIEKEIKNTYNTSAYNAKRLVETEVSRCHSSAFDRFCKETNVKKVKYVARRCNTCDECMSNDGKIFDFNKKPELPRHPMCQCYYYIAE